MKKSFLMYLQSISEVSIRSLFNETDLWGTMDVLYWQLAFNKFGYAAFDALSEETQDNLIHSYHSIYITHPTKKAV